MTMNYKIGQIANKMGLSAHTLRYYDKEGLLPAVHKNSAGLRIFTETDIEWLIVVECLKGCGMPLKEIKHYIDMCLEGDRTIAARLEIFKKQKENLEHQQKQLKKYMEKIDYKIALYNEALQKGSLDAAQRNRCLSAQKQKIFGKEIMAIAGNE